MIYQVLFSKTVGSNRIISVFVFRLLVMVSLCNYQLANDVITQLLINGVLINLLIKKTVILDLEYKRENIDSWRHLLKNIAMAIF